MRYIYLGDKIGRFYGCTERDGQPCDPVLRPDGRVIRGRNRNQLVQWADGTHDVVPGRYLRLKKKLDNANLQTNGHSGYGDTGA